MELVNLLVENLNVDAGQAKGGAGLIFQLAQQKLGDENFAKIARHVPAMESLLAAAPEDKGVAGALGGLVSALGSGNVETLGSAAVLAGGFSKLGLDESAVAKFIPIIMGFLESQGGAELKDLLARVL